MRITKSTTAKLVAAAAVVVTLGANALVAGGSTASPRLTVVKSGGNATFALDETISGWNVNTSASNLFVLAEILNMVWPSAYIVNNTLGVVLNKDLVTSATSALVGGQQVVTYHLNPKAKWQDGTPIRADDFIYNYQVYFGTPFKDKGGAVYDVAGSTGYNQIQSVKGSAPSGGAACQAGSAANRNAGLCPNGATVTVKFVKGQPFADWQALFGGIVPAHVARVVGWNTGFNITQINATHNNNLILSGAWYRVKTYSGNTVVLERNPAYYGAPGKLSTITFLDAPDDTLGISDLTSHTTDVFNPVGATLAIQAQAAAAGSAIKWVGTPGLIFEHIDFNQAVPGLNILDVRKAIALAISRKAIITGAIGALNPTEKPLGNHMFMTNQTGYIDHGTAYNVQNVGAAKVLLAKHYHMGTDGYFQTTGTGSGHDVTFDLASTGNSTRKNVEMPLMIAQLKLAGLKITQTNESDFFTKVAAGQYQIGLFAWVGTPFVSSNESIYCSYNDAKGRCGQNWVHYANPALDKLLFAGASATSPALERADFNAADQILWTNMITYPLFQRVEFFAWNPKLQNVLPNPSSAGVTWNAQQWGFQ